MKIEEKILDKLDNIHNDITYLKVEQAKQGKDITRNTEDLADHIEGVKQTRVMIEANKRHNKLEHEQLGLQIKKINEPLTAKELGKKSLAISGAIGIVVSTIYGILKMAALL